MRCSFHALSLWAAVVMNMAVGTMAATWSLTTIDSTYSPQFLRSGDIDGDNITDVVVSYYSDSQISWYSNVNEDGSSWSETVVTTSIDSPNGIELYDLDQDGDLDIIYCGGPYNSGNHIVGWLENTAGDGSAWTDNTIVSTGATSSFNKVWVADMDGDGYVDVGSAGKWDDAVIWYKNDGTGTSWTATTVGSMNQMVDGKAGDLDGDGDMDVVSVSKEDSSCNFAWWENTAGDGSSWTQTCIVSGSYSEFTAHSTNVVDMDSDGDLDVLVCSGLTPGTFDSSTTYSTVGWVENTDGNFTNFTYHKVSELSGMSTAVGWCNDLWAVDMDGDGDLDMVAAMPHVDLIMWYENTDGSATSWTEYTIDDDSDYPNAIAPFDVNDDGVLDVVAAVSTDQVVGWYELTMPANYTYDFEVADTDGWSTGSAGNAWSVHTGTTSSSSTGPSGAQSNSYYVYTETSSPNSPNVDFDLYRTFVADVETLSFYYSMYGATIGSLRVDVSNDAFSSYTTVWSKSGDQGTDAWSQASIDVTGSGYDSIRFYATSGSSYTGDIALDYIEVTAEGDYYEGDAGSDPSPTPVPTPGPTSEPTDEPTPVPSPVPSPLPTTPVPSPVPSPLPTWVKESSFPLPLTYDVKRGAGGYSGNEGGLKQRMEDGCFGTQEAPYNEGKCGPPGGGYAQNGAYGTGTNCDAGFGKCTTETDRR